MVLELIFIKGQKKCLEKLLLREGKINGEYYIDSLIEDAIELGFNCKIFEVDQYNLVLL